MGESAVSQGERSVLLTGMEKRGVEQHKQRAVPVLHSILMITASSHIIWTKTNVAVGRREWAGCNLRAGSDPGVRRSHVGVMERKWRTKGQDGGGRDRKPIAHLSFPA